MFLVHRREEERDRRNYSTREYQRERGREERLSSFFFIILDDHPFPIYAQSLATCPLTSTNYILPSVFSHVLFES